MSNSALYSPLLQAELSDEDDDEFSIRETHKVKCKIDIEANHGGNVRTAKMLPPKPKDILQYIVMLLVILVLAFGLVLLIVTIVRNVDNPGDAVQPKPHVVKSKKDWQVELNGSGTESCVRTLDMDGDDLPDVLFGLSHAVDLKEVSALDEGHSLKEYCAKKKLTYPCVGFLLALRGYDGKELWRLPARSQVIFITCDTDLNNDGIKDCIVTGRQSTVMAVDVRHGRSLWYSDGSEYPTFYMQYWNVYQAISIADVNEDHVQDIIIANGGDPNIPSAVHERKSGRIMILSGATGKPLGRYLEIPNGRETYMSPVMYKSADGSQYVLVGTGGETVPGDLLAITLPDLLKETGQMDIPDTGGDYRWKTILKQTENSFMLLYIGKTKGIMVPPVIVDVDNDGQKDLVISAFDGSLILLDGQTLTTVWETPFPGEESYSTPAPGYFNDDGTIDFMVHWSTGTWPDYNKSRAVIVDGKKGDILWQRETSLYQMSSDLVLRSNSHNFDHFVLKMRGRKSNITFGQAHGIGVQRIIEKRQAGVTPPPPDRPGECLFMETEMKHKIEGGICGPETDKVSEEVFIVNRNTKDMIAFHETGTSRYEYDVTPPPNEDSCIPVNKDTGKVHMCVPEIPDSRSTDSITDVDGDGSLDLIHVGIKEARIRTVRYSYKAVKFRTIVSRINIPEALQKKKDSTSKTDFEFAPLSMQSWLEYLGTADDSVYYKRTLQ